MSDVDQILAEMAANDRDGATALAERGLDALEAAARGLTGSAPSPPAEIVELLGRLLEVRPAMATIGVAAARAVRQAEGAVRDGASWSDALGRSVACLRRHIGAADAEVARRARDLLGCGGAVVTWSWSATAVASVQAIRPDRVVLAPGLGLGDGVRAAEALLADGVQVEVVPDVVLPEAVSGVRCVVVGADQVLADGSVVNRAGTFALALGAQWFKAPMVVVCQSIKLAGRRHAEREPCPALVDDLPTGASVSAPLFDITPADLVAWIVTEDGVLAPAEAGASGAEVARYLQRLLDEKA